jgi:hypothetical protein
VRNGRIRSKIVAAVAIMASVPFILSTFAASVTVGSGSLNFGQGSQQAVACDSQVYVALAQEWYSAPTPTDATNGYFRVKSVTVSGVDLVACQKTKLRIRLIDNTGREILVGPSDAKVLQMAIPTSDCTGIIIRCSSTWTFIPHRPWRFNLGCDECSDFTFN